MFWSILKQKINSYRITTISDEGVISDDAENLIKMLEQYIKNTPVLGIDDLPDIFDPITKL